MKTFEEVFEAVKERKKRVVLVGSEDKESIIALNEAVDRGFVDGILVGDGKVTKENLESLGIKDKFEIIDSDPHKSCEVGVKIVSSGKGDILMKGLVKTSDLLKAVLNPEWGLRTGSLLSHLTVVEAKDYGRFIGITDGGMIIKPTLDQKVQIIKNAVSFFKRLGVSLPKVACIAAVEVVNPEIPETVEAAELAAMGKRKQIEGCIIDGPLGFDNAIDERAAKVKGVGGDVAGHADILIVPEINSGNFIGKSMDYCAHYTIGGIILGAKVPIIVVSRADEAKAKLASISLGALE
ncbi:MAG: bifunctional enoyl-CoA hydratase/phosphate acetyltransferase [Athalassotoga sp.]|uniref:bifunctional enoyl-CoA hydratase/phosphate acetyltransferase n=1 Tax=Athalassotoga sp. TaxID=2022597 RepID=UPI003D058422